MEALHIIYIQGIRTLPNLGRRDLQVCVNGRAVQQPRELHWKVTARHQTLNACRVGEICGFVSKRKRSDFGGN